MLPPLDAVAPLEPAARGLPAVRDLPRVPLTSLPTPVQRTQHTRKRPRVLD
jgi:hypothetical protein